MINDIPLFLYPLCWWFLLGMTMLETNLLTRILFLPTLFVLFVPVGMLTLLLELPTILMILGQIIWLGVKE